MRNRTCLWSVACAALAAALSFPCDAQHVAAAAPPAGGSASATPAGPAGDAPATAAPASAAPVAGFALGPGDLIDVEVWNEPNVSGKIPIRPDGAIALPLVGELVAAGLTPLELQNVITSRLSSAGGIDHPEVTVVVLEVNSRKVNVIGQVLHPGPYSLATPMTMLDAISAAGGPIPFAHTGRIYMIRTISGKAWRYPFDYNKVISGRAPQQNVALQPGDTIVIP